MITISLDESGTFETFGEEGQSDILFIAGVVYENENKEIERYYEECRLDAYFRKVAKTTGCQYPVDLHLKDDKSNKKNVKRMEEEIRDTLSEFINDATYNGMPVIDDEDLIRINETKDEDKELKVSTAVINDRKGGFYRIATMLYNGEGKSIFKQDETSDLLNDTHLSNLYMNMAHSLVSRLAFHNVFSLNPDKVRFDLATRTIHVDKNNDDVIKKFRNLGYKEDLPKSSNRKKKGNEKFVYYKVANENDYRAMITQKLVELNRTNFKVDRLTVRSIYYGSDVVASERYAFLYLADMICSLLKPKENSISVTKLQESFCECANSFNPYYQNLIFVYDDIDDVYEHAVKSYEEKNYYKRLKVLFSARESTSKFKEYYLSQWFSKVEMLIFEDGKKELSNDDIVNIENAILQFSRYSSSNLLKQDELVYIYEHLEPLVEKLDEKNKYKYKFYDAGITAYNHIGDSVSAEKCFEKCKRNAKYCHFEDYLATLNRRVVMLNDQYRYDEALALSKDILSYHEQLSVLREVLFDTEDITIIAKGRALSQQGQVYSYMRNPEAESSFTDALKQFDENSVDYHITLSYLLHHYIDVENREGYEEQASNYFGGKQDVMEQFAYLQSMTEDEQKNQSFKFAFYVYIKALSTFYADTMNREQKRKVLTWASNVKTSAKKDHVNGHPWELIYKYFALLAVKWNEKEKAEQFVEKMQTIVKEKDAAIENIITGGLIEYYTAIGDTTAAEEAKSRFTECYTAKEDAAEAEKEKNKLKTDYEKWLVYMFR